MYRTRSSQLTMNLPLVCGDVVQMWVSRRLGEREREYIILWTWYFPHNLLHLNKHLYKAHSIKRSFKKEKKKTTRKKKKTYGNSSLALDTSSFVVMLISAFWTQRKMPIHTTSELTLAHRANTHYAGSLHRIYVSAYVYVWSRSTGVWASSLDIDVS